jgi:S1-C subfamily serine protease
LHGPISSRADDIPPARVTVVNAARHGFGVFISADGLILVNQHVVGDLETVGIRLFDGVEVAGQVLDRNTARDVALVKVEAGRTPSLPLRIEQVRLDEEVYTLGPLDDPNSAALVTRGGVRALRTGEFPMIQSDATVYGSGSGGPLLDASGNLIGIAATSVPSPDRGTALNFFIPIGDALRYLNIRPGQPR